MNWLLRVFFPPPPVHNCDCCGLLMVANGYGLCSDCLDHIDRGLDPNDVYSFGGKRANIKLVHDAD